MRETYDEYSKYIKDEKRVIIGVVGYYTGCGISWQNDAVTPNTYSRGKSHEELCALLRNVK